MFSLVVVGDVTDPENKLQVGSAGDIHTSPTLMDEDYPTVADSISRSPTVSVKAHFTSVPVTSKSFSPVDWSSTSKFLTSLV
jgi:hypothetical protein